MKTDEIEFWKDLRTHLGFAWMSRGFDPRFIPECQNLEAIISRRIKKLYEEEEPKP
jgi:hypothetical protein